MGLTVVSGVARSLQPLWTPHAVRLWERAIGAAKDQHELSSYKSQAKGCGQNRNSIGPGLGKTCLGTDNETISIYPKERERTGKKI
jgi:hypothetical protein